MNALDVLNEYKAYLKILARRPNGREKDVEKAEIIMDALERRIATKPLYIDGDYDLPLCPKCRMAIDENEDVGCCSVCGQKLDWSDTE